MLATEVVSCIVYPYFLLFIGPFLASACRSRVVRFLSKRFRTPAEAGAYFNDQKLPSQACASSLSYTMKSSGMQTDPIDSSMFLGILNLVPRESRLPLLSEVFSAYMLTMFKLSVPNDFLHLAASAMLQLSNNGRTNVLYNLAKGMGTLRQDKEDSRFPIKCMPMGLVEYTAQFFAFDSLQQVKRTYKRTYTNHIIIGHLSNGLPSMVADYVL